MRLGIFAKTFAGTDPLTVMRAARDAGYASVQYNMACSGLPAMPETIDSATAAMVAEAARTTGIDIAAVSGTYNMIHPDPAVRADGLRRLGVLIDACAPLGTPMVTLCTGTRDLHDQWRGHPDNQTAEAWPTCWPKWARPAKWPKARASGSGSSPNSPTWSTAPPARAP
jgi:sugar phosphate isomerase/epimerase